MPPARKQRRTFSAAPTSAEAPEAPEFAVEGEYDSGTKWKEVFVCKKRVQGARLMSFIGAAGDLSSGAAPQRAEEIVEFISSCLGPEERERFNALVVSDDKIVDIKPLGEIAGYLVEEYGNRPT